MAAAALTRCKRPQPPKLSLPSPWRDRPSPAGRADHGGAFNEAVALLRNHLNHGAQPSADILADGEAAGITAGLLRRAKVALKVRSVVFYGQWCWRLPGKPRKRQARWAAKDAAGGACGEG
jgi:hypothetical protein